jgi:hypothetical protein
VCLTYVFVVTGTVVKEREMQVLVAIVGIIIGMFQLTAYYSVYVEHGIFSLGSIGEIFLMTVFPPYAWYIAAGFWGFI